jgi:prepilin-type N-terminal cleavage/methylation domain-containing protein
MKTQSKRRGFSLAEILVAVAIIAVVAAVVIPSVGSQLNKGDTARVSQDLISVRSGVEQFLADVRRYPSAVVQLQTKPGTVLANGDSGINASGVFTASQVARWAGPYLTKDFSASGAASGALTGYGQSIITFFRVCDNTTNTATSCSAPAATGRYLTIAIAGLSQSEALAIDVAMDDGNLATGQIRWFSPGGANKDTLRYLALPIQ